MKYRIALCHDNADYLIMVTNENDARIEEHHEAFVRWVTEWIEVL